ncbi:hypothetical protein [Phyllobacterium sp. YR531]|uniref:hypothetical protein n=1 Tax=Phyllobacterium sp. YR531 TaxID=1144343 RepID=UPI00026F5B3A|nr:hypothetical protein [Phyllobacterium sp. YR531]EJN04446.1 hypothetical protein PMI41_02086 [Phyllobacterium sp. YR531]
MIQTALYFALGFLAAVLLALLVVPPIWRRATYLTRKRVEAETPLTLNEIQAQRDGLRAEHALANRKLELMLENAQAKAGKQLAEVSEKDRYVRKLAQDLEQREQKISELEAMLTSGKETIKKASATSAGQEKLLEQRAAELELLHRRLASLATNGDSLKIDLAAQSTRIDNLSDDLKSARQDKRDSDEQKRKAEMELKALRHSLEQETKRRSELDTQANALLRQFADSEAKLARREKDFERANERLRKVLAEGRKQPVIAGDVPRGKQAFIQAQEDDVLREQMNGLAAQVIAMTAKLEGSGSLIDELLGKKGNGDAVARDADGNVIVSLADRIRTLQNVVSKAGKSAEP